MSDGWPGEGGRALQCPPTSALDERCVCVESEDFSLQTKRSSGKLPIRMIRSGYIFGDSASSVERSLSSLCIAASEAGPHRERNAGLPGERHGAEPVHEAWAPAEHTFVGLGERQ